MLCSQPEANSLSPPGSNATAVTPTRSRFECPDRGAPPRVPQHDSLVGSTAGEPPAVGGESQARHQVGVDGLEFRRRTSRRSTSATAGAPSVILFATASMRSSGENAAGPAYGRLRGGSARDRRH